MFFFKFIISCLSIFLYFSFNLANPQRACKYTLYFLLSANKPIFFCYFFKNNKEYFISGAFAEFFCKYPSKLSNHRYFGLILL